MSVCVFLYVFFAAVKVNIMPPITSHKHPVRGAATTPFLPKSWNWDLKRVSSTAKAYTLINLYAFSIELSQSSGKARAGANLHLSLVVGNKICCRCRHCSTRRDLMIPSTYIFRQQGRVAQPRIPTITYPVIAGPWKCDVCLLELIFSLSELEVIIRRAPAFISKFNSWEMKS